MMLCHSLAVGHGMQCDWWECLTKKGSSVAHLLLVMGCNIIDENAWQTNQAVSPTNCWSWDATQLMRLRGKQMKQCHSQPVGHGMRHNWWKCLANKWSSNTHLLLVMGCNKWLMRMPARQMKQCHSLPVSHGMQHDWWECLVNKWSSVTYKLLVMGSNVIDETTWQTNEAVPLTCC